jgi:hypothetical protein
VSTVTGLALCLRLCLCLRQSRSLCQCRRRQLTEKTQGRRGVGRHHTQERSDFSAAAPSAKGAQSDGMRSRAGCGGMRFGVSPRRSPSRFDGYSIKPASILDQGPEGDASRSHRFGSSDLHLMPLFTPQRLRAVRDLRRAYHDPATPRVRASL